MNRFTTLHRSMATGCLLCLLAFLAPPGHSTEKPSGPKKGVTIEGITEYQLDNGLRVLLFPDGSAPIVTVNLTVLVGSRHEGYGETGMAHLLEHMVFKGTPSHPDVPKALRDHGARFNGSTWLDRTNYYETMPATDEDLEFGIHLEADRMINSYVKREDLLSEMTVVRNEFEAGENNPQSILSQRMTAVAYEWHNYGKSTIGNRSDIERVPIDRLQAFYRKHYQPDNAVLIIAGKFDEKKALGYVTKYFGALKRPQRTLDATYTEEPPQDGERTVVLRRVGKVGVVGALYHIPAGPHADFPALEVLENILSSQPSGRLYKALVTSKKANSVSATAFPCHDPGALEILVEVDQNGSLETARDTMIEVLEGLGKQEFTKEEVERAKAKMVKNRELQMNDPNRVGVTLSEWAAQGDWRLFFLHRDRVAKVTPADVARVAGKYLQRSNRTVGLYIPSDKPQRTPVPETPVVADLVKDYKGSQAVAQGETFDPTPANIDKRVEASELPSGVKVALLPKKSRGEAVVAELTLRYGNAESLKGNTTASQLLAQLMARGTQKHTRQEIEDQFDKLKARLSPSSTLGQVSFSIECKRENLPAVLNLLGEILREPSFPQQEFDVLMRQRKDMLEKGLTEPAMLARQSLQRKLSPYPKDDVRYVPTIQEAMTRLQSVTVEQMRKLYTEQVGGQAGELVVIGDFEPASVTKQFGDLLKDWKAGVKYERIARPADTKIAGAREVIETPDKANAVYMAALALAMDDADPDFAALELGDFLLGGGTLSSRLGNRVRQKEGLSYGVGSHFTADALDKSAKVMLFAICNPKNMDKVDKAITEEVDKLLKEGVSASELDEAKGAFLEQLKVQRSNDSALASMLAENLQVGRTFAYYADLEKQIAALTPDAVTKAFQKNVNPKKLVIIRAGDFRSKTSE